MRRTRTLASGGKQTEDSLCEPMMSSLANRPLKVGPRHGVSKRPTGSNEDETGGIWRLQCFALRCFIK